jgi:hypothetical protein
MTSSEPEGKMDRKPAMPPPASIFILRLLLSYVLGTITAPLLWLSPALLSNLEAIGSSLGFLAAVILFSVMLSYKYLILAVFLALLFRRSLWKNLFVWAAASPFAVTVLWAIEVYLFETGEKDFGTFLRSGGSTAAIVFFYSIVYVLIFYFWNRPLRLTA